MDQDTQTTPAIDSSSGKTLPSNADAWAKPVSNLTVHGVPGEANNLNVEGRRATSPVQGFGWMWQKRHWIELKGAEVTPTQVIQTWKENFGSFWPRGNRFYGPITGLKPGEVAVINLSMPARTTLSTGVLVLYADDESFTLMTPQGHVFAGWITFSAYEESGGTIVQAEILMRASDPVYEVGMVVIGHKRENAFWEQTLQNVAAHFGVQALAHTSVECVDRRHQWAQAKNVWHNAQIRTGIFMATRPFRSLAGKVRAR
jgi:hypothetical protein